MEMNGAGLDGVDEVVDEGFELESPVDDATLTTVGGSVRAGRQRRQSWDKSIKIVIVLENEKANMHPSINQHMK